MQTDLLYEVRFGDTGRREGPSPDRGQGRVKGLMVDKTEWKVERDRVRRGPCPDGCEALLCAAG